MAKILADTSGIYALIDSKDENHLRAFAALHSLSKRRLRPILTNFIVAETHALLLSRLGAAASREWLLTQVWPIEPVTLQDEQGAREIIRKYTDKTLSYTDALSFTVMQRMGITTVFGFDPHFEQYGFELLN